MKAELEWKKNKRLLKSIDVHDDVKKAVHEGVRLERTASIQYDIKKQGDVEMLLPNALRKREELRQNQILVGQAQEWYVHWLDELDGV